MHGWWTKGIDYAPIIPENMRLVGYNGDCEMDVFDAAWFNSFNTASRLNGDCGDAWRGI